MKSRASSSPSAFTLIELLVVIVIIAVLAGLIFPVFGKVKKRAAETRVVSNLRQIATAMSAYSAEHDDLLPGPLTQEQYPVFGVDAERDKGSLPKLLAPYLSLSKKEGEAKKQQSGEFDIFECPGATGPNLDEIPGYIMNMEEVPDYKQPAWGKVGDSNPPLKRSTLTAWRDTTNSARSADDNVVLSGKWAMRHTDKPDCKELGISAEWVEKLPKEAVFDDHYQALYFDWHVGRFDPDYKGEKGPPNR